MLIPALAIVGLGTGLSWTGGSPRTTDGLQVAETRALAAQGDSVTAIGSSADQASIGGFSDTWQNTVRIPPSPAAKRGLSHCRAVPPPLSTRWRGPIAFCGPQQCPSTAPAGLTPDQTSSAFSVAAWRSSSSRWLC